MIHPDKDSMWKYLSSAQYERLCDCKSLRADIPAIARCFMLARNLEPEDALVAALEHLDCNSQSFDLSREEYDETVSYLKTL